MKYRAEIDGLRALAVLPVIFSTPVLSSLVEALLAWISSSS